MVGGYQHFLRPFVCPILSERSSISTDVQFIVATLQLVTYQASQENLRDPSERKVSCRINHDGVFRDALEELLPKSTRGKGNGISPEVKAKDRIILLPCGSAARTFVPKPFRSAERASIHIPPD